MANATITPKPDLPSVSPKPNPNQWDTVVNAAHEQAHQSLVKTRDVRHDAGNPKFQSIPRNPDTTSY